MRALSISGRLAGLVLAATLTGLVPAAAQELFATPQDAATALVEAARHPGEGRLDRIFGPGGAGMLSSGDPDEDQRHLDEFLALASRRTDVVAGPGDDKVLVFGTDGWQFPVPLKPVDGKWGFDLVAGQQELTDREIGRNELAVIAACGDFVAAQREYYASLHDDQPVPQYARRFISTPGRHDGLYWDPDSPSDRSPLGDRITPATAGASAGTGRPQAYNGYFFRILTRQGSAAPGGAYSYLVRERLLAGFAMVAWPERWGETGVMTFQCDQMGTVYEANLGERTARRAATILSFDPGPGWTRLDN